MATILEKYSTEEQSYFVLRFLYGQKDSMQRILLKKCVLLTVGSVLSCQADHNWVEKRGKCFADNEVVSHFFLTCITYCIIFSLITVTRMINTVFQHTVALISMISSIYTSFTMQHKILTVIYDHTQPKHDVIKMKVTVTILCCIVTEIYIDEIQIS
jgi:glucan phosphoethanolaminetransferase (alkaline phosphatase superfamily)